VQVVPAARHAVVFGSRRPGADDARMRPVTGGGHRCCRALAVGRRKENPGSA